MIRINFYLHSLYILEEKLQKHDILQAFLFFFMIASIYVLSLSVRLPGEGAIFLPLGALLHPVPVAISLLARIARRPVCTFPKEDYTLSPCDSGHNPKYAAKH